MKLGMLSGSFLGTATFAALICASAAQAASNLPLMPMPLSVVEADATLPISGPIALSIRGCAVAKLAPGVGRFDRDLRALVGTPLTGKKTDVAIHCTAHDPNFATVDAREGYSLAVTGEGVAIEADGETGVLRALATLRQLVGRDGNGPVFQQVRIIDAPRFAWRGVMIDVARHFMEIETLKRQIDAMELAKLNVLHLHLSDNEAFRVESRKYPKLTQVARDGRFYTQAEMRDLVHYARERGVRIVPEIDMPGHNLAAITAYPELAVAPVSPDDTLATAKGALNPASEKTYTFVRNLLGEMMPLFPDRYFHVGGDEVSNAAWKDSSEVAAFQARHRLKTKQEVEAWFHARVRKILAGAGKITIGWDEMLEGQPPKDVTIQSWRSSNPVSTATAKGNHVIVSAGYYLDHLQPAEYLYAVDPLDPVAYTTMTPKVLEQVRRNPVTAALVSDGLVAKPLPPLTAEQEKLVLGGEGPLWSEIVSDEMLDGRLWPRALALAERLWSDKALRDPESMYRRLLPATGQMRSLGLLDESRRDRMVTRLSPEAPDVVRRLLDVVAPVRMYAHMRGKPGAANQTPQALVEPADAASTDGTPARRFRTRVGAYLAGDQAMADSLRTDLAGWRDNEQPFAKVAEGRPLLQAAVPTARDIAALGKLGLAALDAIERRQPVTSEQVAVGRRLIKKLTDFENASKSLMAASMMPQPPDHLIVLVTPDVERLLDAAEATSRR